MTQIYFQADPAFDQSGKLKNIFKENNLLNNTDFCKCQEENYNFKNKTNSSEGIIILSKNYFANRSDWFCLSRCSAHR